jgi:hypothetical protein
LKYFEKPRARFEELKANPELIAKRLAKWNEIANKIANEKFAKMKEIVWL